jgi:eukaryotic-like serine/threonine-protein kinase
VTDRAADRKAVKKTSRRRSNVPTGTVTFLFTDIEGSTAMWEDHPDQMQEALARHDEILHAAIEARGGYVFKMMGDACYAAFGNTREALEATLAAQRALFAEKWEKGTEIRVRMALHTGVPEEKEGDYFGPPVNRVARLLSAGHGGQILLSAVTYGLVRDVVRHMESGAELRDLGEYRLRDLRYTERIYHLVVPDLPTDFPPPKGEPITAGTLPDQQQTPPRPQEQQTPPPKPQEEGATPAAVVGPPPPAAQPGEGGEEEHAAAVAPPPPRADRYTRKRTIGGGGMAQVYLAHDEVLDRDVALKVLRQQYADDERLVERFRREAKNAASLSHPNIVAVHDRGETEDGAYYIVMEYMAGGTLKDRIQKEGLLPPAVATTLALQVARALEAAHRRGIIHRDVKPQNVLLTEDGEAKVADFGIARAASSSTMTKTGSVLGTAHYLSPEQALGQPASPQSDLYSLGVVLYEMLTGEVPYDAETPMGIAMKHVSGQMRPPKEVNPDVPEGINAVAVRLLAPDPENRYQSAAEVVEDLERVLRGELPGGVITDPVEEPSSGTVAITEPSEVSSDRGSSLVDTPVGPGSGGRVETKEQETVPPPPAPPEDTEGAGDGGRRWPKALPWALAAAGIVALLALVLALRILGGQETSQVPSPVSSGREMVAVPDMVGESRDEAEKTLRSEGFEVNSETQKSSGENDAKVIAQSPSGGEAEKGSEITLTVGEAVAPGPAPGYNLIQDPTGGLTVEVPPSWGIDTGQDSEYPSGVASRSWSTWLGEEITSSITTAPSLDAWYSPDQPGTSGAYLVASRTLAQNYSDDDLIFYGLFSGQATNCEQGPYEDFNNSSVSGKIQTWYNCRGEGITNFVVAAAPEGRECVVVLQARLGDEGHREAVQHLLDTVNVDCGQIAGIDTRDQDVEFANSSAEIPAG